MYLGHCFKSATVAGAGVCVEFQQFVSVESALVLFFAMLAAIAVVRMLTVSLSKTKIGSSQAWQVMKRCALWRLCQLTTKAH